MTCFLCATVTLLVIGGLEPGAAEGLRAVDLAAPPHVSDHVFAQALHVLVRCREITIIQSKKISKQSVEGVIMYLVSSTELRMLVSDRDLSAAASLTRKEKGQVVPFN